MFRFSLLRRGRPALLVWGTLACTGLAMAQTPPASAPLPADAPATGGIEQRTERIRHEDALTRVDELRVGGQTRNITVQPKNGAPAYEVAPATAGEDPNAARNGSSGRSRWRLLDF